MNDTKTLHVLTEDQFINKLNFKTIVKQKISQPMYVMDDDDPTKFARDNHGKKIRVYKMIDGKEVGQDKFSEIVTITYNWTDCIFKDMVDLAMSTVKILHAKTRKQGHEAVLAMNNTECMIKQELLTKTRAAAANTDPSKMTDAELDIWQAGILAEMERRTAAKKE